IPATTPAGARKETWVKRISAFLKEPPPTSQCVSMRLRYVRARCRFFWRIREDEEIEPSATWTRRSGIFGQSGLASPLSVAMVVDSERNGARASATITPKHVRVLASEDGSKL